jgi:hypothetical protein
MHFVQEKEIAIFADYTKSTAMGRAFEFRKERKFKRWDKMSKVFTRLGKEIVMAVKVGGPDPSSNAKLRTVIKMRKGRKCPRTALRAPSSVLPTKMKRITKR